MPKINLEFKWSLPDYRPIVVMASGSDEESCLENATWNYDVPDPSRFYHLGDLPSPTYEKLEAEIREQARTKLGGVDA